MPSRQTNNIYYTTGMFTLSNPYAHVTNAAFGQARLRPGLSFDSGLLRSAKVYSPYLCGATSPKTINF
jgi:hypothetical protein